MHYRRGRSGRKKVSSEQGTLSTGELSSGVEKWISGFHYCSPKETGNPLFSFLLSTPEAGLSSQTPIKRTQKYRCYTPFWVFPDFPKISKCPYAKNIIDTVFSFEDRSGATMFFELVNFQPRASKAQKYYFLQNGP
jgi:hypothetical protein